MWLLILVTLIVDPSFEPKVEARFRDRDSCMAAASKANHVGQLDKPRPATLVHLCYRLEFPV